MNINFVVVVVVVSFQRVTFTFQLHVNPRMFQIKKKNLKNAIKNCMATKKRTKKNKKEQKRTKKQKQEQQKNVIVF